MIPLSTCGRVYGAGVCFISSTSNPWDSALNGLRWDTDIYLYMLRWSWAHIVVYAWQWRGGILLNIH